MVLLHQSQPQQSQQQGNITEMIHRLKTRLALANFKRQHGYERFDLYTLESNLLLKKKQQYSRVIKKKTAIPNIVTTQHSGRHRYYPTSSSNNSSNSSSHSNRASISPLIIYNHSINNKSPSSPLLYSRYPLSEKRSTSPQQQYKSIIPTDEDAANVLVMLHNMSSHSNKPTTASSSLCT